jgi:hypothetical protein
LLKIAQSWTKILDQSFVPRDGSRGNYAWASDFWGPRSTQAGGIAVALPTTHQIAEEQNDETTGIDHVQKTAGANNPTAGDHL